MNLDKYKDFFHDGTVVAIDHHAQTIVLIMESSQLLPEWNTDEIVLSKHNTLSGKMHLEGVRKITINGEEYTKNWKMEYDSSDVYDLEVEQNKMTLVISWINYPPNEAIETDFFTIEIEADKIYWENLPSLCDSEWEN